MVPRFLTRPVVPALLAWGGFLVAFFLIADLFIMPWAAGKYRPVATVPYVVGLDSLAAADTLKARGLLLMIDSTGDHSRTIPAGRILQQAPDSGSVVKQGRRIWVTMSLGRERVITPTRGMR
jgi:beta-lactam-binding protein with PASTA domain